MGTMKSFKSFLLERDMGTVYADLKHNDLTKRGGGRLQVFIDKVKDAEEFLTKKGAAIIDKSEASKLEAEISQKGYSTTLKAKLNGEPANLKYPNDFLKTPEFGGKGKGFGTAAEDRALTSFRKELEAAMVKENAGVLHMKVGGREVTVAGIVSTPGVPKSDFHLIDDKGEEVAWLSHKDGRSAKDFQQYGGLTHKVFRLSKDVEKFLEDVRQASNGKLERGQSFMREVKDNKVIHQSVWGVDYGKARGRNNVDEFHQGPMTLKKVGKYYTIKSTHSDTNGNLPTGEYKAVFYARFTSDRGNLGVANSRIGVFAKGQMPRTVKVI